MDRCFEFRFATPYRLAGLPFGVTPSKCRVSVGPDRVVARFGWWRAEVALGTIGAVTITGPYGFAKTAGPAHLSFTDKGLTFATNGDRGVCLQSRVPFRGIEPFGVILHHSLTVTVADCDALVAALRGGIEGSPSQ